MSRRVIHRANGSPWAVSRMSLSISRGMLTLSLVLAVASAPLLAQPVIPNPLVQPSAAAAGGGSTPAAAGAAATTPAAAGGGGGAPTAAGGRSVPPAAAGGRSAPPVASPRPLDASPMAPLPPGLEGGAEQPSIPLAVQERVSGLYVAAIVDRSAVLRSQLAVPQMTFAGGGGGARSTEPGAGSQGAGGGGPVGGLPSAAAPNVYRSSSFVVRDGQVFDLIDRHRVLARVSRDTVVLYLLPEKGTRHEESKVVFRGSIDSLIASPPVPARGLMESPDGGIDGRARRDLANVDPRGGGVVRGGAGGATTGTAPAAGTPSR